MMDEVDSDYWYAHRHELESDQIFRTLEGSLVKLDRTVPGDGSKWYVADWHNGWSYYDSTIEPGDLRSMPLPEPIV